MGGADDFEDYRRADIRFHIGVAEAADSPRLVTAMTEVQGQMSDLIALIAHPSEVLTRSNDQHRRLAKLLRKRDVPPRSAAARAHRGDRAHHRRPPARSPRAGSRLSRPSAPKRAERQDNEVRIGSQQTI